MYAPKRLDTLFDMKIDNIGYESDFVDELIQMHVYIEAKALYKSKNLAEYWNNINTVNKYPSSEQQPNVFYLHFYLHIWLYLLSAMQTKFLQDRWSDWTCRTVVISD